MTNTIRDTPLEHPRAELRTRPIRIAALVRRARLLAMSALAGFGQLVVVEAW